EIAVPGLDHVADRRTRCRLAHPDYRYIIVMNATTTAAMRAGVLRQAGAPIGIEEVQLDDPGPREILVRTAAASVCHSDYSVRSGQIPWQLPVVMGHESAGVVEAVGSHVTYCRPGDRVITCLS